MIACGIDPSLYGTGLVFFDTKKNQLYTSRIKTEPSKGFEPVIALALRIGRLIEKHKPKIIAIEEPFVYPGRIQGAMRVFSLHAILRYLIYQNHKKSLIYTYCPSSWKKKFTGHGNSKKGQVVWTALRDYGWKFFNSDIADAFGIMQAALLDYKSATENKANESYENAGSHSLGNRVRSE